LSIINYLMYKFTSKIHFHFECKIDIKIPNLLIRLFYLQLLEFLLKKITFEKYLLVKIMKALIQNHFLNLL